MAGNLLYVNARIKSLENNLLSPVQLGRLAECDTLNDAFKILQECGYGAGLAIEDYKSYENLIALKEREATDFFRENLIEKSGLDAVLLINDYHNAKALIKAKYLRLKNAEDMLLPDGLFETEKMKEEIFNDDYSRFPLPMAEALDAVDVAFADGNRSPRLIDLLLDKAMFKDMASRVKKSNQKVLQEYVVFLIDTNNISSFIRCKKLGLDIKFFEEGFIGDGKLKKDTFTELYNDSIDAFRDKLKYTDYGELAEIAADSDGGMVRFETAVDNRVNKLFKDNKYDMFSVAPIVGFYLGQLTEIKVIKLTLSALKNNLDSGLLRQRLRELYA